MKCFQCGCEDVKQESVNMGNHFDLVFHCDGCGYEWEE